LTSHLNRLPHGDALDLATGLGGSAIELARRGWNVAAIDISEVGVRIAAESAKRSGVRIDWIIANLAEFQLPCERFDVVTVFNYLDRRRLPGEIVRSLRLGGILLFETYTLSQLQVPSNHIRNPDYLLRPGELLLMFPGLRVRAYRDITHGDRAIASLLAEKLNR
jgi:2-polyprenyl-3-methyl-5-hydroxy-6-metoxy-1,4-benzoquinol methylase